ncbi:hypothetical protein [Pseudomonas sp. Irchel 3A18]|uniref:hypothetical protein n=1 Tax=Pseudomonas sp. Irchel 3A18 TaxID=2008905 RepID=UPI0013584DC8|nr:hypothetical protein [Pseudomonas sp. Irchel 3A18]
MTQHINQRRNARPYVDCTNAQKRDLAFYAMYLIGMTRTEQDRSLERVEVR